jgi:hypothetical protein
LFGCKTKHSSRGLFGFVDIFFGSLADFGVFFFFDSFGNKSAQIIEPFRDGTPCEFEPCVDMFRCFNKDALFLFLFIFIGTVDFFSFFYLLRSSRNSLCFFIFFIFVFHVSFFLHAGIDSISIFVDFDDPLVLWVSFEVQNQSKLRVFLIVDDLLGSVDCVFEVVDPEQQHTVVGQEDFQFA